MRKAIKLFEVAWGKTEMQCFLICHRLTKSGSYFPSSLHPPLSLPLSLLHSLPYSLPPSVPPSLTPFSSMRVAHWLPEHIDPKITSKRPADWLGWDVQREEGKGWSHRKMRRKPDPAIGKIVPGRQWGAGARWVWCCFGLLREFRCLSALDMQQRHTDLPHGRKSPLTPFD